MQPKEKKGNLRLIKQRKVGSTKKGNVGYTVKRARDRM